MSYRYRLFNPDGEDVGETQTAALLTPGDEIIRGSEKNLRVLDVVAVMETDSPFVAFLTVEPAE